MNTVYHIRDDRGVEATTTDAERADRLARAGYTVKARVGFDD